jgi:glycyl-tRNA synthetase
MAENSNLKLDTIVKFARRKGFVYQSSEIYGGFTATYDYGQLGVLLKKNIEHLWRFWNVTRRTDMFEIEGSIFMHPKVWEASGHVASFGDLLVEDLVTHKRYRADHLVEEAGILENAGSLTTSEIDGLIVQNGLKSPEGNSLSKAKKFNLLVKTHLGPVEDESSIVYLKGESCQNIYLNWKAVQETSRKKLPFGVAQMGKAFRNEITTKQYLFRTREFEQMDVQYFYDPEHRFVDGVSIYELWKNIRFDFYTKSLGIDPANLRWRQHDPNERAFYASDAWDIDYRFGELGFKEMEGLHDRGSYDLDQHSKFSGQDLTYQDPQNPSRRFNPPIIEASAGFNRVFLACLFEFYSEEKLTDEAGQEEMRIVVKFPFDLAPYKLAVLPLMKKDGLSEKAFEIFSTLRKKGISCDYDESGSIGKRYRRQDESGTPWCVCVDYDTLGKDQGEKHLEDTVSLRHRDTMSQVRVHIKDIEKWLDTQSFDQFPQSKDKI